MYSDEGYGKLLTSIALIDKLVEEFHLATMGCVQPDGTINAENAAIIVENMHWLSGFVGVIGIAAAAMASPESIRIYLEEIEKVAANVEKVRTDNMFEEIIKNSGLDKTD